MVYDVQLTVYGVLLFYVIYNPSGVTQKEIRNYKFWKDLDLYRSANRIDTVGSDWIVFIFLLTVEELLSKVHTDVQRWDCVMERLRLFTKSYDKMSLFMGKQLIVKRVTLQLSYNVLVTLLSLLRFFILVK